MLSGKLRPFCLGLNVLTHCGLVMPDGTQIWINIGSGNGLLLDGTKPLPDPALELSCPVALSGLTSFMRFVCIVEHLKLGLNNF